LGFMELLGSLTKGGASSGGLTEALGGLLRSDSPVGGLDGLLGKLQAEGLGDVGASWVSKGKNLEVSPEQVEAVLGNEQVKAIAGKLGIEPEKAAQQISRYLPQIVDGLTPDGKVPDAASLQQELGKLTST